MELLEQAYLACKVRSDAHNAWVDTIRNPKNGWASYKPEDKPADVPDMTNSERSALELYEWLANPPDKYFLYITHKPTFGFGSFVSDAATTWTGTPLGNVRFGREWRDNFGGTRQAVTVYGNNGVHYVGTYFKSAGDYARVRKAARVLCGPRKGQKQ